MSVAESVQLTPHEIYKLIETGMAQVDEEITRQSSSGVPLIDRIGQYICSSGGKLETPNRR